MDRPKLERNLDGLQVVVEQLAPRAGMRAAVAAARVFGPTIVELLTGDQITIGRFRITLLDVMELYAGRVVQGAAYEKGEWQAASLSIEQYPELRGAYTFLARKVMESIEQLSPDAVMDLSDDLILGVTVINGARVSKSEVLDAVVPDALTMIGILRMALEVNLRPFVRVLATLAGSSPAQT